jgi:hypothetical protein
MQKAEASELEQRGIWSLPPVALPDHEIRRNFQNSLAAPNARWHFGYYQKSFKGFGDCRPPRLFLQDEFMRWETKLHEWFLWLCMDVSTCSEKVSHEIQ